LPAHDALHSPSSRAIPENDPQKAISIYLECVEEIVKFDKAGSVAAAWRRARHPVNRLSMLLEKAGRLQEALDEIIQYDKFKDHFGLLTADYKSLKARRERLGKKLHLSI
jgi:hypothetical protein